MISDVGQVYVFQSKGGNMVSDTDNRSLKKKPRTTLYDHLSAAGEYLLSVLMTVLGAIKDGVCGFVQHNEERLSAIGKAIAGWFKKAGRLLASPFVRYGKAFRLGAADVAKVRREKGFFSALLAVIRFIGRFLFGKHGLAYSVFNYALPVVSMVMLFNIVTYANNMTYAVRLSVNGDFVGYIESETVFTNAERIVQQRINYMDGSKEPVTFTPQYQLESVEYGSTLTENQLADKLLTSMGAEIEYAYGLYIGSSFYGAILDKDIIDNALDGLLDVYRTGAANEKVAFETPVTYEPGLYLSDSIVSEESVIDIITSKRSVADYYTVVDGDSPLGVATKLGMTVEEVEALNPGFSTNMMYVGDQILIDQEIPYLNVTVTRTEIYDEATPYETTYQEDSSRYDGVQVVVQEGVYGTDRITADVSYINGQQVRKKILKRQTVTEPTVKVVALGTKPHPTDLPISIQDVEIGQMYWPVGGPTGGEISEMMYGYGGYYRHAGIDIRAPYGTPIIAAESGTVTQSGWRSGYGYCVTINHGNGIETVYGHASYLHVTVGEKVTQGQQIADVGSTGYSTGNHLHFEVRINGICVNPINYLPKHAISPWCVVY